MGHRTCCRILISITPFFRISFRIEIPNKNMQGHCFQTIQRQIMILPIKTRVLSP